MPHVNPNRPVHGVGGVQGPSISPDEISFNAMPEGVGFSSSSKQLVANVAVIKEKRFLSGSWLEKYIRNADATLSMVDKAIGTMESMAWQKAKVSPLAALIGTVFYTGSLLAQAAIKAAIWLPVVIGTSIAGVGGGVIGGVLGLLFGEEGDTIRWAKTGFRGMSNTVGWTLGSVATIVSGLSIVARWPLILTGHFGAWCLERRTPEDPKKQEIKGFVLAIAMRQTFQDSVSLWDAGGNSIWEMIKNTRYPLNSKEELLVVALNAGANPYSTNWGWGPNTPNWELNPNLLRWEKDVKNLSEESIKEIVDKLVGDQKVADQQEKEKLEHSRDKLKHAEQPALGPPNSPPPNDGSSELGQPPAY